MADLAQGQSHFAVSTSRRLSPAGEDGQITADDRTDRRRVSESLAPRLPCHDPQFEPVTLDLNGRVIIRALGDEKARPSELVLSNSRFAGEPIRLNSNRQYLARAIRLGFREVHLNSADAPVVCQDDRRRYGWALLDKEGVIKPSDSAIVTASPISSPIATTTSKKVHDMPTTNTPVAPVKSVTRRVGPTTTANSTSPLDQAIALRDSLRTAASAAHQLVRSLKHHQRESRIVATTLASLKQLQKAAG